MSLPRHEALLLVGPTGSGKTPLGDILEERGLWGRRCVHFDFGARLRGAAASDPLPPGLTADELDLIRASLSAGTLLERERMPLVLKILRGFLLDNDVGPEDIIVLNGMPRHIDQAEALDHVVHVGAVIVLECPADVILERIGRDAGGDRAGRSDDSPSEIRAKLDIFLERTIPLARHYSDRGTAIISVMVAVETGAGDIYAILENRIPGPAGRA
jgi:adenylate kinase